jgi:proteasome lid subunit RPN8/RPN11
MKVRIFDTGKVYAPSVVFDQRAYEWIRAIVDQHDSEVGFYAFVDRRDDNSFFIRDVYYPKHDLVSGATCEISPEGQTDLMVSLVEKDREDDIVNLKVWGHSHVNMGVTPSGQDHNQAVDMAKSNGDYIVRLIVNKRREIGISIYDYANNLIFDEVKHTIAQSNDERISSARIEMILNVIDTVENKNEAINQINDIIEENYFYTEAVANIQQNKSKNIPTNVVGYNHGSQIDLFKKKQDMDLLEEEDWQKAYRDAMMDDPFGNGY